MSSTTPPVNVRSRGKTGLSSATIAKLVAVGVILLLILIFVLQNTESVQLTFLFWDFGFPLWLLFVLALAGGLLVGMGLLAVLQRRSRRERRR